MKAILLRHTGGPSVLEYVEAPTPVPGEGEVLVKADTIGVSMPEVLVRKGVYAWMPPLPAIPGIELSGTVVEQSRDVAEPMVGQPVFVSARDLPVRAGCYAEYIAVPARAAHPLPPGCELEAAACLSNYQVAYHVLHTAARGVAAASVLVHTAASGVGSAAVPRPAAARRGRAGARAPRKRAGHRQAAVEAVTAQSPRGGWAAAPSSASLRSAPSPAVRERVDPARRAGWVRTGRFPLPGRIRLRRRCAAPAHR